MKNQKGFILPILILVVLVGFVVIFYLRLPKYRTGAILSTPSPSNPSIGKNTFISNIFSFEYPEGYTIQKTDDPELIILTGYSDDNVEEIYIDWRKNEFSNITVDKYIEKMEQTDIINSKIETSLGLDMVVVHNGKLGGSFGVARGENRVFIIYPKSNRLIKLTTSISTNTFEKFDQILSTFKFLD